MANKLQIRICGQEYILVSENSREYMLEVADYVDRKMVAVKNMNGRLSTSMVAVLVALNVADDLIKEKEQAKKQIESQAAEIAILKKRYEEAVRKVEELQKNPGFQNRPNPPRH